MIRAALISLFAAPACAATLHVIEATPCGTIHTPHEDMAGPVLMTERGSRKYVCGPYPANPLAYDMLADLKGPHPEPATGAIFPTPGAVARAPNAGAALRAASWRVSDGPAPLPPPSLTGAGPSVFFETHIHVTGCPCDCCPVRTPEEPGPAPVPLAASGWLLLAGLGALVWRARR